MQIPGKSVMTESEHPKISAFVISRNEALKIADCLKSLKWVDEIVVVDDFSTDGTPEICRSYDVKFVQHGFTGFKDQKSHAMSLASYDWVLELDADERVSDGMRESILALRKEDFSRFSCFEFRRKTRFWGKWIGHSSLYPDYKSRLYKKLDGEWSAGNIHERFITGGLTKKIAADIVHCQDLDLHDYLLRTVRYANLSALEMHGRGKRARILHFTIRPLYTFFYRYLFRLGFLDGVHGFVISAMGALGTFVKYMKLYELQKTELLTAKTASAEWEHPPQ
jgi:glycosyltransferase involved in cell wall biosynthesis